MSSDLAAYMIPWLLPSDEAPVSAPSGPFAVVLSGADGGVNGGYVEVPDSPVLAITTTFTMYFEVWCDASSYLSSKIQWNGTNGFIVYMYPVSGATDDLFVGIGGPLDSGAADGARTIDGWTFGAWQKVAIVVDVDQATLASSLRIFIDGVEQLATYENPSGTGLQFYSPIESAGSQPLRFGALYFDGIDTIGAATVKFTNWRFYTVALTPSEVLQLGSGDDVTRGIAAHFPCSEGAGTTITDVVSGLVGTFQNPSNCSWEPL